MASLHKLSHSGVKSDILPVIDYIGVLVHAIEGVSETKKLALMALLHVAALGMVEFYSTCFKI